MSKYRSFNVAYCKPGCQSYVMGVKSLLRFIHHHHRDCIEAIPLDSFSGRRLVVDRNNFMHYIAAKVEDRMNKLHLSKAESGLVLATMCNVLVHNLSPLMNNHIDLVIVMDGKIPEMKLAHAMSKNGFNLPLENIEFAQEREESQCAEDIGDIGDREDREEREERRDRDDRDDREDRGDAHDTDDWVTEKRGRRFSRRSNNFTTAHKVASDNVRTSRECQGNLPLTPIMMPYTAFDRSADDIKCTCLVRPRHKSATRAGERSIDPKCPLHRALPKGTYMISYGKRSIKAKISSQSGSHSNKKHRSYNRKRMDSVAAASSPYPSPFPSPSPSPSASASASADGLVWYRQTVHNCRDGKAVRGTRRRASPGAQHGRSMSVNTYSGDHCSLFKEEFLTGVYSAATDIYTRKFMHTSHNSNNNRTCAMNAMERKSYFVDMMLMLGIPVIRATGEAEMTCCAMLSSNLVSGIISRDTDHLVIGCRDLIIAIRNESVESLNMTKLLSKLSMTQEAFVDFCLLCGTDYNMPTESQSRGILLPEKAMSIIQQYGSIECALESVKLPFTQFTKCRKTYSFPKGLLSNVPKFYNSSLITPKKHVWAQNRQIMPLIGMHQSAVNIVDRYYGL